MDVALGLVALVVLAAATLAGAWWIRRRRDLYVVRLSLADAPEPYWSEIRETLAQARLVSAAALREGCRRWPAVAPPSR